MPLYYVIPITRGPRILGAAPPHLPLIQGDENTPPPAPPAASDAYRHEFVTPRTSGGEMNIIKNEMRKKWGGRDKPSEQEERAAGKKNLRWPKKMAGVPRSSAGLGGKDS